MPLKKGSSEEDFEFNLKELMAAGHPREQALAIAEKIKRGEDCGMDEASARKLDRKSVV